MLVSAYFLSAHYETDFFYVAYKPHSPLPYEVVYPCAYDRPLTVLSINACADLKSKCA